MNKEIEEMLHWFDYTLKNYDMDKKCGALTVDSIYSLLPNQQIKIINIINSLQSRIDKAIKYINTTTIDSRSCYHFRNTIYSILQGKEMK